MLQGSETARGVAAPKHTGFWQPVTTGGLIATLAGCLWIMLAISRDDDGFLSILDGFNLVVHEAGHPLFSVFGETMMFWGGTLMQLIVPLVVAGAFLRGRAALSFCIAAFWFFQNFLNIARYQADARAQELPLVGGGDHDWANIFLQLDVLEHDTAIASVVRTIGWTGMTASVVAAIVVWEISRRSASADDRAAA